jgi:hypothetical protein
MKELQLSQGKFALIDDADFDLVKMHRWSAVHNGKLWYAIRSMRDSDRSKNLSMHRAIMNAPRGMVVHHINGNGLDNRRENLVLMTRSQSNSSGRPTKLDATLAAMKEVENRQGYVTIMDIVSTGTVSERTARTYMAMLVKRGEWIKLPPVTVERRGRGGIRHRYHSAPSINASQESNQGGLS